MMDGLKFKSILQQINEEEYKKCFICLTDGQEIMLRKGDIVNLTLENDFLRVQDYDDFIHRSVVHIINVNQVTCIRLEQDKQDNEPVDDYHKDLEEGYEKLVKEKVKARDGKEQIPLTLIHQTLPINRVRPIITYF